MVKVLPNSTRFFSAIYDSPDFDTRTTLWNDLCNLANTNTGAWLIGETLMKSFMLGRSLAG